LFCQDVKFIFPNQYNFYFYDTLDKSLFISQQRACSHGCIRLAQPFELEIFLLRNNAEWTGNTIRSGMNKNTEKWVKLNELIPVLIVYFTS
jgi:murein L,D-transpeptidase YcbB/YkuD